MNSAIPENFVCFELVVDSQSNSSPAWYSVEVAVEQPPSLEFGVEFMHCATICIYLAMATLNILTESVMPVIPHHQKCVSADPKLSSP